MKRLHLKILEYLREKSGMATPSEIAYGVGLTFRQVNAHLRMLRLQGHIEQIDGGWVLVEGISTSKKEPSPVYANGGDE